ncbi:MAG TPA: hypothetical protein P5089_01935 [Candidatus Portnoybacteria bacterium]|nr:hypothetical protein [Candidatus Portnoybacteria bacterium]
MAKVINLKPQEDITSVIERLWETGEEGVYLVASKETAILKNIIAMKLLKREAERLGKEIILITKDTLGREMAKRVGLASKTVLPKAKLEEIEEEEEKEQEVFKEVPTQKFENLLEDEVKARREGFPASRQFSDIRPKGAVVERRSIEVEEKEEKITLPPEEPIDVELFEPEENKEEPAKEERMSFKDFYFPKQKKEEELEEVDEEEEEAEGENEEAEEAPEEAEDELEEEFPIHGLANGRRIMVKEKRSFFSWLPSFNFNFRKIGDSLKLEKIQSEKSRRRPTVPIFSGKFLGIFIGAALLVAMLALYFILPKAEISLKAQAEEINQNSIITADKGISKIDAASNKIPAQLIKLDKRQSQDFSTTGQRQVNDKAKGKITIYNEYSSSPQALVEKTRFVSDGGLTFRLSKTITVPGAKIQDGKIVPSSIEAEVVADEAGDKYNIAPGRFTIPGFQGTPKYTTFYGQSTSAMSGGASGLMKVLSQDDYNKAKDSLWQSLQPALDSEFKAQLPGELKIIEGAMKEELSGVETSVAVGSPAEKFTMTLKGTATAVLFDEKDIIEIIKKKLGEKLSDDKELVSPAEKIGYQMTSVDLSRGQVAMKITIAAKIVWKVNEDALRQEIAGQNEKAIRDIFAKHSEVSEAKVVFWPFWVKSAPANLNKVIIKVEP